MKIKDLKKLLENLDDNDQIIFEKNNKSNFETIVEYDFPNTLTEVYVENPDDFDKRFDDSYGHYKVYDLNYYYKLRHEKLCNQSFNKLSKPSLEKNEYKNYKVYILGKK